jgi:DnaJ-class molecular chaperone
MSTAIIFTSCEESDHKCMKCNGSGKVRDEYGYFAYVSCPRCGCKGYLTY